MIELPHRDAPEFEPLRLPRRPSWIMPQADRSLAAVMSSVLGLLGRDQHGFADLERYWPEAAPTSSGRVVLLCVDGLGFKELGRSAALAALWSAYGSWITSVFPSITSCALTSLYQGLAPARHGIAGHRIWKDCPGAVVDMLRMRIVGARASLHDAGFSFDQWKREPSLLDLAPGSGVQLLPQYIVGSGLSRVAYGPTRLLGYVDPIEAFTQLTHLLPQTDNGWIGLYVPLIDTLSHRLGGATVEVGMALRHLAELLVTTARRLDETVVRDTTVVVVSDHGHCDIRDVIPLHHGTGEWLRAHCRAVGASGRVLHLYEPDDAVVPYLERIVDGRGLVLPFEDVAPLTQADGSPEQRRWLRRSLGDLVAVLDDGVNWEHEAAPYDPQHGALVSQHGALDWNEMVVPLIVAPMAALRDLEGPGVPHAL